MAECHQGTGDDPQGYQVSPGYRAVGQGYHGVGQRRQNRGGQEPSCPTPTDPAGGHRAHGDHDDPHDDQQVHGQGEISQWEGDEVTQYREAHVAHAFIDQLQADWSKGDAGQGRPLG